MRRTDKNIVYQKIAEKIKKGDRVACADMYYLALDEKRIDWLGWLDRQLEGVILTSGSDAEVVKAYELDKKVVLGMARDDFDAYMRYMEWEREPEKRFYEPRRRRLRVCADAITALERGDLELVSLSLPPGTGKSTLGIFALTWMAGKHPEQPCLTGSHNSAFIRGAYDECLRFIGGEGGEYLWSDVFPGVGVVGTNAKDCRIDLGTRKRFDTLQFTTIGSGNAGLYRCERLLYCDDLVSGIEEALNAERLDALWERYTTDLRQRKKGECRELHIATRWSVRDVIGRLEDVYGGSDRARFIRMAAVDENGESNFDYDYGVGFSTKFYKEQKEVMDEVSWKALYMNSPVEREGRLYREEELRRYWELPEGKPDAVIAVCDTKDTGEDYCVMPVAYQYGEDYYIEDVVCDNSNPEVVESRLVAKLVDNGVQVARFESNSAGGKIAEKVQRLVREKGGKTSISTRFTTANKTTKIIVNSPFVKNRMLFKNSEDREYRKFVQMLCGYSMVGKNKHDDVPDAMAMLAEYCESLEGGKAVVFKRPW